MASWPAGHPDEIQIRAAMAHNAERISCKRTVTRGDLARFDNIISFLSALCEYASCDMYDDAWNLRNHLVPFKPGDAHYNLEN